MRKEKTNLKRLFALLSFTIILGILFMPVSCGDDDDDRDITVLTWEKAFGGSGWDVGYSVQQTTDKGYIIAGWTSSYGAGSTDVYLIKTGARGDVEWEKTFGGIGREFGYSVQQTTDKGYIIAGWTSESIDIAGDVYLVKTDKDGHLLWEKSFGGADNYNGRSVKQTSDGGYIIAGWTSSYDDYRVFLIKTGSKGDVEWEKTFEGVGDAFGYSVQQTSDNGYIIVGKTTEAIDIAGDVYLLKTDSNGNLLWEETFGGYGDDGGYSVQQTSDGGYIIAGGTLSFSENQYLPIQKVYLIKTDSRGFAEWEKTFGGDLGNSGNSVQQTSDGGYIIAGGTLSYFSGGSDVYLIKTDSDGNILWERTFGSSDDSNNAYSVQQTSDGGYIIAGETGDYGSPITKVVYIIKTDADGNIH
jgi:hypothetical protein